MSEANEEKKPSIIIDDDWKSQVEKEREQLREQAAEKTADEHPTASAESPAANTRTEQSESIEMPPASFSVLVMMLSTQAFAALGMAPGPDGEPMSPQLPLAKHFIDTLAVLEEKTTGNLDPREEKMLADALTELRLAYVSANKRK